MAKQVVKPATAWVPNSTTPRADQAYKTGNRPAGAGKYSDADYPLVPTYNETGAIFFDSAATGANDGSSWANAYTDETTALTALCAASAGTMLTCRGTFDIGTGIVLAGLGGVGNASNWYQFRGDPVNGCTIISSSENGIEFQDQAYWIISNFTITSGENIFTYRNFQYPGTMNHMTYRNLTSTMTSYISGGNGGAGVVHVDGASASYVGVFDSVLEGPGLVGSTNTAGLFFTRIHEWRVHNCVMHNVPTGFYYKHFATAGYAANGGHFIDNYVYNTAGLAGHIASKGCEYKNSIFDGDLLIADDGGGDNGADDNTFDHVTVTGYVDFNNADNLSQGNNFINSIVEGQYLSVPYQIVENGTNTSDYNLYGGTIRHQNTTYTLSEWQAGSVPAGQDVNSLAGSPTYTGGVSPTTIAGFALSSGNGVGAADDGSDMGADVTTVGVAA